MTEYGATGVESVSVSVVWDEQAGAERDHVRINRDGSLTYARTRERPAAEAIGRDEHAQPPSARLPWGCSHCLLLNHESRRTCHRCGRRRPDEREQEGDDRGHAEA